MRSFLLFVSSLSFCLSLSGKTSSEKIFQDVYWRECDSINAHYYIILKDTLIDNERVTVTRTYKNNGVLISKGLYSDYENKIRNGESQHFYDSGQVFYSENFKNGVREGELKSYFENGATCRIEVYHKDSMVVGNCFTKAGEDTVFYPMEVMPEFKGGNKALMQFLSSNVRYPKKAANRGIQGKVQVHFIISPDGNVTDIQVFEKIDPFLDAEAIRVISLMDGKWNPGLQENKPVSVRYLLPINFLLH